MQTQQVIFRGHIYIGTYMYINITVVNEKDAIHLKNSKERFMGGFGERKEKEEML